MCYFSRPPMIRRFRFWLLLFPNIIAAVAFAGASPQITPEFIEKVEASHDPAAQDQLIASLAPTISARTFRDQFLKHIYDLVLRGEYLRAANDCELVMRLARAEGDGEDLAAAQVNLGYVLRESGDLPGALAMLEDALKFYSAHHEYAHGLISAEQSRGITYLAQSDFAHALQSFHRALALSEKVNYEEGIIPALNSIGEVYRNQGEPERALEFYQRARAIVGNDDAWNMAFIFNNIGMTYGALGDYERAVENIERARAVAEKANFQPRVENALAALGDLELKRDRVDAARAQYRQSLDLARKLRDVPGEAQALLGLARVAEASGDFASGRKQAADAAVLFQKLDQKVQLAAALTQSGRCLRGLKQDEEAAAEFQKAIAAVERVRDQVAGGETEREQFFADQIAPYQEMISLLVRQNRPVAALAMAERASARVLLEITSGARTEFSTALSADEQKTLRDLEIKVATARRELARTTDGAALDEAQRACHRAEAARDEFETLSATAHPGLRRGTPPPPLDSLTPLAPLFKNGRTALLRYALTENESYLFLLTRGENEKEPHLILRSLGRNRSELARLTSDFRTRLATRSLAWEKPARDLYDHLIRPVEKELTGTDSIVIVPDGPLCELPFQALERSADSPLLAERAIRYAPSLTLLARAQEKPASKPPQHQLLAFINPALHKPNENKITRVALMRDWQALPESEKQAPELQRIYDLGSSEVLIGAEARESVFKAKAGEAEILHFATHGVVDDRAPLYSYLLFSQVGVAPNEDGRLEARELMQLKLHARLAILCGCETARGRVTAGEGMIGLSWGFMVAGCPATIVSQWKVDSASSTPLMIELHRRLHDGLDNAEALRLASLELRKDARYRHPFYWAPFVLVGR